MIDALNAQRRAAAARGNEVRSRRAAVKKAIAAGDVDLVKVLRTEVLDDVAEEIPVWQLLRAVPGIGPTTAGEILVDVQVAGERRPRDLELEKRGEIAAALEERLAS